MGVSPLRVALADDAVLFREGMARILAEAGFAVIGQVGDGDALVELVRIDPSDVAVIDLRMPPAHCSQGLEAAAAIRSRAPQVGSLLLSQHMEAHIRIIFTKLDLHLDEREHRRVLAVLAFLRM